MQSEGPLEDMAHSSNSRFVVPTEQPTHVAGGCHQFGFAIEIKGNHLVAITCDTSKILMNSTPHVNEAFWSI